MSGKFYLSEISLPELCGRLRDSLYAVETCHGDAMSQLNLTEGNGEDGTVPSSARFQELAAVMRKARQTSGEGQGCQELEKLWESFNASASATADNLNGAVDETAGNTTNDILATICAR